MTDTFGATELLPRPPSGRQFSARRKVRLSDASPGGRLRLDAVARYLQDVANDDVGDAGLPDTMFWIVRRTLIRVTAPASVGENLTLTTWCSGHGSRWAERRTQLVGDGGGFLDAVSVWVSVDGETGRPKRLEQQFFDVWGEAAAGRVVRARLLHPAPGSHGSSTWPIRYADLDVVGHVNNAVYWTAVEEAMASSRTHGDVTAEMEFAAGVAPRAVVRLIEAAEDGTHRLWWSVNDKVAASACFRINPAALPGPPR